MKTFKNMLSEVAQPKSGDEINFKAKHEIDFMDHPESEEHQHTSKAKKAKRIADYDEGEDEDVYEALDPVGKEDGDVDNDGDEDDSDDYLRNRRNVIKKSMDEGLRFGVERMPIKLVKDLRLMADNVLGYDFTDKGISLSFDREIDKKQLAKLLKTKDYMIDYDGKSGREHVYHISESTRNVAENADDAATRAAVARAVAHGNKMVAAKAAMQDRQRRIANQKHAANKAAQEAALRSREAKNNAAAPKKESIEENAFVAKAAHSKKAGKKKFDIGGDKYPVTVKDKNVEKIIESHFKVGEKVKCIASDTMGTVVKSDPKEVGKYYTVEKEDGELAKFGPDELASLGLKEATATSFDTYELYAAANKKKGLQVIPKRLWDNLKKDSVNEAAPKLKPDFVQAQRKRDAEHQASMGKTPTGRKKREPSSSSTQRSLASMRESTNRNLTEQVVSYLATGTTGSATDWFILDYTVKPGVSPLHLRKELDKKAVSLGLLGANVVAQWSGSIDKELAAAKAKLAGGSKLLGSIKMELNQKIADLTKAKATMSKGKELKESTKTLVENFKVGLVSLNDGSKVTLKKSDADLLNQMFSDLNSTNKKKMMKVAMTDKSGFEEILGFAREAI